MRIKNNLSSINLNNTFTVDRIFVNENFYYIDILKFYEVDIE